MKHLSIGHTMHSAKDSGMRDSGNCNHIRRRRRRRLKTKQKVEQEKKKNKHEHLPFSSPQQKQIFFLLKLFISLVYMVEAALVALTEFYVLERERIKSECTYICSVAKNTSTMPFNIFPLDRPLRHPLNLFLVYNLPSWAIHF